MHGLCDLAAFPGVQVCFVRSSQYFYSSFGIFILVPEQVRLCSVFGVKFSSPHRYIMLGVAKRAVLILFCQNFCGMTQWCSTTLVNITSASHLATRVEKKKSVKGTNIEGRLIHRTIVPAVHLYWLVST
jgi:hypothetical protein